MLSGTSLRSEMSTDDLVTAEDDAKEKENSDTEGAGEEEIRFVPSSMVLRNYRV